MAGSGVITGTVLSATGTPISDATVEIENLAGAGRMTTTTDPAGTFRLASVPPGTYRMTTRTGTLVGAPSQDILIAADRSTAITVTMQNATNVTTGATTALITVEDAQPIEGLETPQLRYVNNTRNIHPAITCATAQAVPSNRSLSPRGRTARDCSAVVVSRDHKGANDNSYNHHRPSRDHVARPRRPCRRTAAVREGPSTRR